MSMYILGFCGSHGGAVVTHLPPTSEVSGSNAGPYVGKLEVANNGQQFTVQNLDQLYILVSFFHKNPLS